MKLTFSSIPTVELQWIVKHIENIIKTAKQKHMDRNEFIFNTLTDMHSTVASRLYTKTEAIEKPKNRDQIWTSWMLILKINNKIMCQYFLLII